MKTNGQPKVEKGIPIPPIHGRKDTGYAALLRQLEIGDSILLKNCKGNSASNAAQGVFGAGRYAVRKEGDGYRVWRTA